MRSVKALEPASDMQDSDLQLVSVACKNTLAKCSQGSQAFSQKIFKKFIKNIFVNYFNRLWGKVENFLCVLKMRMSGGWVKLIEKVKYVGRL